MKIGVLHMQTTLLFARKYRRKSAYKIKILHRREIMKWGTSNLCMTTLTMIRFPYFQQKIDVSVQKGFSSIHKCITAIRRQSEQHENFAKVVIILYRGRYLRKLIVVDIHQLYVTHKNKHEFLRMLDSIDCMY
uniref:Uncharacterized protein n=1 Tax=Lactuca sativa TaxID=4236 RepID=A0A9R1X3I7_LACSA|nr:hypothetical protein LSAT_V11C700356780 [Lactuca sativa]